MTKNSDEVALAIDGGTTNTRARLLRGDVLVATASRPVGVRNVAMSGSKAPLIQAVAECVAEVVQTAGISVRDISLAAASGMITSNVGLCEVPHVLAPAGIDDLARHVIAARFPEIGDLEIRMIPGIKTLPETASQSASVESLAHTDILRGEECETFGILSATDRRSPLCLLLPGSHTKLVHVDTANRITASFTTVAGELMQALAERTILASSIDWPATGPPDWPAIETGGACARESGLLRGGFAIRLLDVIAGTERSFRTWFFVGLVVAADIGDLQRWPRLVPEVPLLVGGREPLRSVYSFLLRSVWAGAIDVLTDDAVELSTARGAAAIARRSQSGESTARFR